MTLIRGSHERALLDTCDAMSVARHHAAVKRNGAHSLHRVGHALLEQGNSDTTRVQSAAEAHLRTASKVPVSVVIQFPKALGAWVEKCLDQGWPVATLVVALIEERMEPALARAIVEALARRREVGQPSPLRSVTLDEAEISDFSELASGESIWARTVQVRTLKTTETS